MFVCTSRPLARVLAAVSLVALAVGSAALAATAPATHAGPPAAHLISHSKEAVPFVADDYARALAAAHARRVPIFVETWAPW